MDRRRFPILVWSVPDVAFWDVMLQGRQQFVQSAVEITIIIPYLGDLDQIDDAQLSDKSPRLALQ